MSSVSIGLTKDREYMRYKKSLLQEIHWLIENIFILRFL